MWKNKVFVIWPQWCDSSHEKPKNFMAIITSLVAISAAIWWLLNLKKWRKAVAPLPPGPRGLPIIGYLPFLGTHLHKTFTKLAGVYGPIYKLWLGNKLCVVVSSPLLAKELVRDQDTIFANRDPPIAALVYTHGGNDIAWCPYGPEWKKMRKLFVSKMMSNASLDACYSLRKQEVNKVIRDVCSRSGKPIDIGELSVSASISVVQNMLWGCTLEGDEKGTNLGVELRALFGELMVLLGALNISDIFPVLSRFDIQGIAKRTKEISVHVEKIIDSAIERYEKNRGRVGNSDGKKDFLQILLELKEQEDSATSLTMAQLKAMLKDIILGGTDTTTTMIEWTMAELMQNPKVMKKVQEELSEVVGTDSSVEEFHLPKLQYLDAVVKETLRLHPALPLLVPRCPNQSAIVGGYTIPKGARIMLNVWAIHRDPQLWDSPLEFRPDRFLNDSENLDYLGNKFQYMPFGSGRRVCAGIPLAERMLMFVLASLLHSFEWKLPYGTKLDLSDKFGIVIKKLNPLVIIPAPRLSNPELY